MVGLVVTFRRSESDVQCIDRHVPTIQVSHQGAAGICVISGRDLLWPGPTFVTTDFGHKRRDDIAQNYDNRSGQKWSKRRTP